MWCTCRILHLGFIILIQVVMKIIYLLCVFFNVPQAYWMRRTTVPMCTMSTKGTRTSMVSETCVTTVLLNIIPIRCVDATNAHFLPPHPTAIIHIHLPVFFYSSANICVSLETEPLWIAPNGPLSFITPRNIGSKSCMELKGTSVQ